MLKLKSFFIGASLFALSSTSVQALDLYEYSRSKCIKEFGRVCADVPSRSQRILNARAERMGKKPSGVKPPLSDTAAGVKRKITGDAIDKVTRDPDTKRLLRGVFR